MTDHDTAQGVISHVYIMALKVVWLKACGGRFGGYSMLFAVAPQRKIGGLVPVLMSIGPQILLAQEFRRGQLTSVS